MLPEQKDVITAGIKRKDKNIAQEKKTNKQTEKPKQQSKNIGIHIWKWFHNEKCKKNMKIVSHNLKSFIKMDSSSLEMDSFGIILVLTLTRRSILIYLDGFDERASAKAHEHIQMRRLLAQ